MKVKDPTVAEQWQDLSAKLQAIYGEISALREACEHTFATYKNGANTGNYDPSADWYWRDWTCEDCGKRWTTDQDVWSPQG